MPEEIPRRIDTTRYTLAEKAIADAMAAVEAAGESVSLTHAVVLLGWAKEHVADFVDGVPTREITPMLAPTAAPRTETAPMGATCARCVHYDGTCAAPDVRSAVRPPIPPTYPACLGGFTPRAPAAPTPPPAGAAGDVPTLSPASRGALSAQPWAPPTPLAPTPREAVEPEKDDDGETTCADCGELYALRAGEERTLLCDHCAHAAVERLTADLAREREAVRDLIRECTRERERAANAEADLARVTVELVSLDAEFTAYRNGRGMRTETAEKERDTARREAEEARAEVRRLGIRSMAEAERATKDAALVLRAVGDMNEAKERAEKAAAELVALRQADVDWKRAMEAARSVEAALRADLCAAREALLTEGVARDAARAEAATWRKGVEDANRLSQERQARAEAAERELAAAQAAHTKAVDLGLRHLATAAKMEGERDAAVKDASQAEERLEVLRQLAADVVRWSGAPPELARLRAGLADLKPHALRPVVWAFAHAMEAKLSLHDEKRGPRGWMGDKERGLSRASPLWLAKALWGEVHKLEGAARRGLAGGDLLADAVDVALNAMMVADVCDAILAPAPGSAS